jgi:hypothetical protein
MDEVLLPDEPMDDDDLCDRDVAYWTGRFEAAPARWFRMSRGKHIGYGERLSEGFDMMGIGGEETSDG